VVIFIYKYNHMKKLHLSLLLLFTVALSAFTYDIWQKLEMAEKEANEFIFNNLRQGSLNFPRTEAIKHIAIGDRHEMVKELGDHMKRYTESAEFKEAYQEARSAYLPQNPKKDIGTLMQNRITELEQDITTTEEDLKKTIGAMKKLYEGTLAELKKEYKALKNPNDANHTFYKSSLEERAAEENEEAASTNEEQRKEMEKYFPANPKVLIKQRLQEFLSLTADIDFNAKLVKQGNKMKFADPKLEAKSNVWKSCFRSGKETITAARAYAQTWLKELK
jgi:hypothetical protein